MMAIGSFLVTTALNSQVEATLSLIVASALYRTEGTSVMHLIPLWPKLVEHLSVTLVTTTILPPLTPSTTSMKSTKSTRTLKTPFKSRSRNLLHVLTNGLTLLVPKLNLPITPPTFHLERSSAFLRLLCEQTPIPITGSKLYLNMTPLDGRLPCWMNTTAF